MELSVSSTLCFGAVADSFQTRRGWLKNGKMVLRPTALTLDRLHDPREVIEPGSPLWSALKAAYDLALLWQFSKVKPPEELEEP